MRNRLAIEREASSAAQTPQFVQVILPELFPFAEAPASGDSTGGASFSAFGGHITGRHVELVPGKRVVQAWRAKTWPEGLHSIVRFELQAEGAGTKLVFDHDGFPADAKDHLAKGWQSNYWDKLSNVG